jgi:hypothetical protein
MDYLKVKARNDRIEELDRSISSQEKDIKLLEDYLEMSE